MTSTSTYHHGNLRDTLVAATIAQLAQQSDATLSLRELARTVGVSIAAVYRHFPSKEALLADVAAAGFASLIAKWEAELPPQGSLPSEQRFQLLGQQYIEFALAAPAHYRLMFEHQDVRQFPALMEAAQACFQYVLQTAGAAVREAGLDPRWDKAAASAGWSLGHGYVMLLLSGRLAMADGGDDLSPAMVPRFFQLPVEALRQAALPGGATAIKSDGPSDRRVPTSGTFMRNISIDTLSVTARQCIAVSCLQRFCQRFDIHHPALSAFAGHVWKVAQLAPGDFAAWEHGFASLAVTGMGDPWPDDIRLAMPGHLLGTLEQLVGHVLETSACTWHGDDLPASRRQLEAVLDICARHGVATPPLAHYVQHDAALRGGWGPVLTDAEVRRWQALL